MTDPRETLASIRAQADAATEGPWEAFGTVIDAYTGPGDCAGCSGIPSPAHEPACYHSEIAGAGERDAEFIAAARTDVPRLVAALEAALNEHPKGVFHSFTGAVPWCGECDCTYPCPTVDAITQALTAP